MDDPSTTPSNPTRRERHHPHRRSSNASGGLEPHTPPLRLLCKASSATALADAAIAADSSPAPGCCNLLFVSVGGIEAAVRVFEVIIEAERGKGSPFVSFRVMIPKLKVGLFMGKKGQNVMKIRKETGTRIRVLPLAAFSDAPVASPSEDEVAQISGDPLAVKEAVIAVSKFLLVNTPSRRDHVDARNSGVSHTEPHPNSKPHDEGHMQERKLFWHEISYRLCLNRNVGGVIEKCARIIKTLEKETGTSIRFEDFIGQSNERVITITGFESQESGFSPTQNAVINLFTRIGDAFMERRVGVEKEVTARLLVPADQISCLFSGGGSIISKIGNITDTDISIFASSKILNCASGNDGVVQVSGKVQNVRVGLLQVMNKLREHIFLSKMSSNAGSACQLQQRSTMSLSEGYGAANNESSTPFDFDLQTTLIHGLDNLQLNSSSHPLSPNLRRPETADDCSITMHSYGGGHTPSRSAEGVGRGNKTITVRSTTVEIAVPGDCMPFVYGSNGDNLACIRQISGAKITVNDPSPRDSEGIVVISGTPDQTLAAQSLLQAYILSEKP